MRMPKHAVGRRFLTTLLLGVLLCVPRPGLAAEGQQRYTLGETKLSLPGPKQHSWNNPKTYPPLVLVPKRYKGLTRHLLALYASPSLNNFSKMYNNHGALFFMGSAKKTWTKEEFALLKAKLMPVKTEWGEAELQDREQFFKKFLAERADLKIPKRKVKTYYGRLQQSVVLYDTETAVALAYRHKKKGEQDKYFTVSLSLVRDKLIGTAYYQVAPDSKEQQRADNLTLDWQQIIIESNGGM
jgi:hypothetical protein